MEMAGRGETRQSAPPGAWPPLHRLARRARGVIDRVLEIESASGLLLVTVAVIAMAWANSPWADSYVRLWDTPVGVRVGPLVFERSLAWFVNDVVMVVFFFVAGLEIRREMHDGELSEWRRAALPAIAALGGMVVPALIYLAIAGDPLTRPGWGTPVATDIAFAVGILSILGRRVPPALRVLLLALAVIDDVGAIVVIAVFYTSGVEATGLAIAGTAVATILAMQAAGVRSSLAYVPPAAVAWAGTYLAGVHPTIAGVVVGLMTPVRAWWLPSDLRGALTGALDRLGDSRNPGRSQDVADPARAVALAAREARSPVARHAERLQPWVAYGIMPAFALANAGVAISAGGLDGPAARVVAGVAVGLVVGKPIGVLIACALAIRLGVAALPTGLGWRHLVVLGAVAGVGFTMSLFVAQLAFADPYLLAGAKSGTLAGSVVAAVVGIGIGRILLEDPRRATAGGGGGRSTSA